MAWNGETFSEGEKSSRIVGKLEGIDLLVVFDVEMLSWLTSSDCSSEIGI